MHLIGIILFTVEFSGGICGAINPNSLGVGVDPPWVIHRIAGFFAGFFLTWFVLYLITIICSDFIAAFGP